MKIKDTKIYLRPEMIIVEFAWEKPVCLVASATGSSGNGIDDYEINDTDLNWF